MTGLLFKAGPIQGFRFCLQRRVAGLFTSQVAVASDIDGASLTELTAPVAERNGGAAAGDGKAIDGGLAAQRMA
jgi:hypothetical protein